jgi:hypothetical protein
MSNLFAQQREDIISLKRGVERAAILRPFLEAKEAIRRVSITLVEEKRFTSSLGVQVRAGLGVAAAGAEQTFEKGEQRTLRGF